MNGKNGTKLARNRMTHIQAIKETDALRLYVASSEHGTLTATQLAQRLGEAAGIEVSVDTLQRLVTDLNIAVTFAAQPSQTGVPQSGFGWVRQWFGRHDDELKRLREELAALRMLVDSQQVELRTQSDTLAQLRRDIGA